MRILQSIRTAPIRISARLYGDNSEAGMTTAEYAVGTVAACGFGGILLTIIKSPFITGLLKDLFKKALHM